MRKLFEGDDLPTTDEQFPAAGVRVQLDRHVYGHAAGAEGVVVRGHAKGTGKVLVRFDSTGYQISVPRGALRSAV
ncbi:MAG TPA: hypothetical protein VLJ44_12045 [Gaiellaceae bacterium]|nr:hypothetical protein [Gaiellaceae bacterium]